MRKLKIILKLLIDGGYQSLFLHHITHYLYTNNFKIPALFIARFNKFLTGIEIEPGAKISKSAKINHGAGIVIGYDSIIGENVIIRQNVTLGRSRTGELTKNQRVHPIIKDNVEIGAGAVILGDITVEKDAIIGANAVITKDVPQNAIVAGIPGKILRYR